MRPLKDTIEKQLNNEQVVEMARINVNEKKLFPFDKWIIKIWSNDHNPAHFHIICEDWDVSFEIPTGKLLNINSRGKNSGILKYMNDNIKEWLSNKCAVQPAISNAQNAELQWLQIHN